MLEFEKEGFDEVALLIAFGVVGPGGEAVGLRRNNGLNALVVKPLEHPFFGVVSSVGQKLPSLQVAQQGVSPLQVVRLTGREEETRRVAERVTGGVNLRTQSAAAASDGLVFAPFFRAPALC